MRGPRGASKRGGGSRFSSGLSPRPLRESFVDVHPPVTPRVANPRTNLSVYDWQEAVPPASDGPPMGGVQSLLVLGAFLVVMLVVPWIMTRDRGDANRKLQPPSEVGGPRFTSDRERRLWLWTGAVVFVIYATLGPVAELAAALRSRNLLRITSGGFLIVAVGVGAFLWAKTRPGRREIGAALGVAMVYLTAYLRIPVPEARSHLFEYGLVAMLIYHALSERRRNGRHVPVPGLIAVVAASLLGWIDEGIQAFLPNRSYHLFDVGFNALAASMAILATMLLEWMRRADLGRRLKARFR